MQKLPPLPRGRVPAWTETLAGKQLNALKRLIDDDPRLPLVANYMRHWQTPRRPVREFVQKWTEMSARQLGNDFLRWLIDGAPPFATICIRVWPEMTKEEALQEFSDEWNARVVPLRPARRLRPRERLVRGAFFFCEHYLAKKSYPKIAGDWAQRTKAWSRGHEPGNDDAVREAFLEWRKLPKQERKNSEDVDTRQQVARWLKLPHRRVR